MKSGPAHAKARAKSVATSKRPEGASSEELPASGWHQQSVRGYHMAAARPNNKLGLRSRRSGPMRCDATKPYRIAGAV